MIEYDVFGWPDVDISTLAVLVRAAGHTLDLALEWSEGRATGELGGPAYYVRLLAYPTKGAWAVVPHSEFGLAIVRASNRELIRHQVFAGRLITWRMRVDRHEVSDIVEAEGWCAEEMFHRALGTENELALHEIDIALYPPEPAKRDEDAADPPAVADAARLQSALSAARAAGSATVQRHDRSTYVARTEESPEGCAHTIYLDVLTGQALIEALVRERIPRRRSSLERFAGADPAAR